MSKGGFLVRRINISNNVAPKIGGVGTLEYQLWVDDGGSFYVQITKNSDGGRLSPWLFSVAEYASNRKGTIGKPFGLDEANGGERKSGNNNDGGFLRAVLLHLLDGGVPI
jgi:hypothetical protein